MPNLYRMGNNTPANFTPRNPQDTVGPARGLSLRLGHGPERNQVIDSDLIVVPLIALATPTVNIPDHWSIRPNPDPQNALLIAWANQRAQLINPGPNNWANPNVPDNTILVSDARIGQIN